MLSRGEPGSVVTGLGVVREEGPWDSENSKTYSCLPALGLEASALCPSMVVVRTDLRAGETQSGGDHLPDLVLVGTPHPTDNEVH